MPPASSPNQKLAQSLAVLKKLQDEGRSVFRGSDFKRLDRERLSNWGALREIIRGWYISSSPTENDGDSTAFYACFYEFLAAYCTHRFGEEWSLGPEGSMAIHAQNPIIPRQVVVYAKSGTNTMTRFLGDTGLLDYRSNNLPDPSKVLVKRYGPSTEGGFNLRYLSIPQTLIQVSENYFKSSPTDAKIVLAQVKDVSDLLAGLLQGGHAVIAGRLAGALRAQDRAEDADRILNTMRANLHTCPEINPFAPHDTFVLKRAEHPCSLRIREMWQRFRLEIEEIFPAAPGLPVDNAMYLKEVTERHIEDAYHSLSIEGYKVTTALIKRIADGQWDVESKRTKNDRDAMAAKGYFDAFNQVKESLSGTTGILEGNNAGKVLQRDHAYWYMKLFGPSVEAGLLEPYHLAGYRSNPVYLRNAMHVPPPPEAVREAMPTFFELLAEEPSAAVRAVLGHYIFVYIHPYMDGNGRIGRFIMNAMLASGGYPWTVIRVERRAEYMAALDQASANGDIKPFANFVAVHLNPGI